MAGHAQLKFVMTESSKTQISLTGLICMLRILGVWTLLKKEILKLVFTLCVAGQGFGNRPSLLGEPPAFAGFGGGMLGGGMGGFGQPGFGNTQFGILTFKYKIVQPPF